ncbi:MAG: SH3 domain-containing protein [Gemmatimonadota bacterium]
MKARSRILAPSILALACVTAAGMAKDGADPSERLEVVVEETVLKWSATGRLLGHLNRGTALERLGGRSEWTRVGVHGWMWRPSLERSGDSWLVTPVRENLRAEPNGRILGTLERGVKVRRVGEDGKWFEVEMIGWLPDAAVRSSAADPEGSTAAGEREGWAGASDERTRTGAAAEPTTPSSSTPSSERGTASRVEEEIDLRTAPGGAILTRVPSGTVLRAVERRGAWTRVQVEGWVPSEAVRTDGSTASGPEAVALAPDRFTGRRVQWTLEHVALQRAEEWRSEFEAGEWFGLARVPDRTAYVYLVVPPGLLDEFRGLSPFETIRVEGKIRTGKSELTGNPVLEVARLLP